MEWRQDRTLPADVEIRICSPWHDESPVELRINFQDSGKTLLARWPAQYSLAGSLEALAQGIFIPGTTPGPISVDVMDYFPHLQGLAVEERHVFVPKLDGSLPTTFKRASRYWPAIGSLKFVAVHACLPPEADALALIDLLAPTAEGVAGDGHLVLATTYHDGKTAARAALVTCILGY